MLFRLTSDRDLDTIALRPLETANPPSQVIKVVSSHAGVTKGKHQSLMYKDKFIHSPGISSLLQTIVFNLPHFLWKWQQNSRFKPKKKETISSSWWVLKADRLLPLARLISVGLQYNPGLRVKGKWNCYMYQLSSCNLYLRSNGNVFGGQVLLLNLIFFHFRKKPRGNQISINN